ncbi:MAG: 3-methyl-2-oxobutanoate dehydrogenase subunit beta [Candidatus Atabeyarchaeum deiterrae]|jgi:pyruvate ferredoxin oxidoreductase beta subunit
MILGFPEEELLLPGNSSCAGCGATLALRYTLKALGNRTIMVVPACCTSVIQGLYPRSALDIPTLNIAFAAAAAAASGIVAALEARREDDITVLSWAGDGGTADIGIQALSGAAERGTNFLYICYDNEAYMNTGIQRSGATPYGMKTTTTPTGKREKKKDLPMIMASHEIEYVATACPSYPRDLYDKVKKAKDLKGTRYLHILAPCPSGWLCDGSLTVEVGRRAITSGMWILFEISNEKLELTGPSKNLVDPAKRTPIEEYLKIQGRYDGLTKEDVDVIKKWVSHQWDKYLRLR